MNDVRLSDDEQLIYRQKQIDFVSGLHGGSAWELLLLMTVLPLSLMAWSSMRRLIGNASRVSGSLLEAIFLFTVPSFSYMYPDYLLPLLFSLILLGISFPLTPATLPQQQQHDQKAHHLPFVSAYRATLMISTCIAILAVDFIAFPRRFAKTETYGVSLMDLGVGSFVFARGLIAIPEIPRSASQLARSSLPLILLGLIRLVTVKGSGYQEHVSEYGVHWNFFFTLAFISLWAGFTQRFHLTHPLFSFGLIAAQQALLRGGLSHYVFDHPRYNLLHMNKEGLVSLLGYCALYSIGQNVASFFYRTISKPVAAAPDLLKPLMQTILLGLTCWLLGVVADTHIEPCSRRLVNASYIFFTSGYNLFVLGLFMFVSFISTTAVLPLVYQCVNQHQLLVFLLANLMTGLVNFSINTIEYSHHAGFLIVQIYLLALFVSAHVAQRIKK